MYSDQLQLVNFEQAKRLKDVGFDWGCNHLFSKDGVLLPCNGLCNHNQYNVGFSSPAVALVLKWFRDVKDVANDVYYSNGGWVYSFSSGYSNFVSHNDAHKIPIYEVAESALLDELLNFISL